MTDIDDHTSLIFYGNNYGCSFNYMSSCVLCKKSWIQVQLK